MCDGFLLSWGNLTDQYISWGRCCLLRHASFNILNGLNAQILIIQEKHIQTVCTTFIISFPEVGIISSEVGSKLHIYVYVKFFLHNVAYEL